MHIEGSGLKPQIMGFWNVVEGEGGWIIVTGFLAVWIKGLFFF